MICVLCTACSYTKSQDLNFPFMSANSITAAGDYVSAAYLIVAPKGSVGTGSFVSYNGGLYFVSAKHVLTAIDFSDTSSDNRVTLVGSGRKGQEIGNVYMFDPKTVFYYHSPVYDISAVLVGIATDNGIKLLKSIKQLHRRKSNYFWFNPIGVNRPQDIPFALGSPVFTIGYPSELRPAATILPWVNQGVAAAFEGTRGCYIVSMAVFGGNSGGPVFQRNLYVSHHGLTSGSTSYVGLVSAFVEAGKRIVLDSSHVQLHYGSSTNTYIANSGYAIIESVEHVEQMLGKFFKNLPNDMQEKISSEGSSNPPFLGPK